MFNHQNRELNEALARLAADLPDTRWLVLLNKHGGIKAKFPNSLIETDRASAMGAAIQSLGQRVSRELNGGDLQYVLIAGEIGWHMVIVINEDNYLELGVRPGASIDLLFGALRSSIPPFLHAIGVEQPPHWLIG